MIEPANREESEAPRAPRVRTAGEPSRRGSGSSRDSSRRPQRPQRGSGSGNNRSGGRGRRPASMSNRPNAGQSSGFVRVLAPLALAIFAIASFAVVTNTDDTPKKAATEKTSSSKSATTKDGGSVTVTTKKTYTVKSGDSFAAIAEKLNIDADTLAQLNSDVDPRALQPGQKLKLR